MADDHSWMDAIPDAVGPSAPAAAASEHKTDVSWMDAIPDAAHQPAEKPPEPPGFAQQVLGSTAAALHTIPRGVIGGKTADYIDAATAAPLRMLYGDMPPPEQPPEGHLPAEQVYGTFGSQPPQGFRLASPAQAFKEGLRHANQETQTLHDFAPIASVGGELMGGAAGGALAAPALGWQRAAANAKFLEKAGGAGSYIARNAGFGGLMSSLSGGDPVTGAVIGSALPTVHAAVAAPVSAIAQGPVGRGVKRLGALFSQGSREASVGRTLNDTVAGSPIETSPVGPLDLAQATNNPNVAAKVDLAPGYNADANARLRAAQQAGVASKIAEIGAPASAADASTEGTNAIRQLSQLTRQREGELWNHPALVDFAFPTQTVKQSAQTALNAIQKDDPGLLLGMTGPIQDALKGIGGLSDRANLANINSFVGVLKSVARRPPMDNPRAGALASRLLDGVGKGVDDTVNSSGAPASVQTAYQAARDFTRTRAGIFGTQDMRSVMTKNPTGAFSADPSEAMKRFFNFSNGSGEGPANIKELQDFADQIKQVWVNRGPKFTELTDARNTLRDSTRSYVASALTDAARVNPGENMNPKTMQDFLRDNRPWMQSSGLFQKPQLDAADALMGYADMLRRPEQLLRQVNSATQPRSARADTFIEQIMHPWARRLIEVSGALAGGHQHGAAGLVVGGLAGGAFEHSVQGAETAMREMMGHALLDPSVAQALMMKATAANRLMISPQARQAIDAMRAAVGSDIAPQMLSRPASEPAVAVGH